MWFTSVPKTINVSVKICISFKGNRCADVTSRFLRVKLQTVLGFREHIFVVKSKVAKTSTFLSKQIFHISGPNQKKRTLLVYIFQSQLLQASTNYSGVLVLNEVI